MSQPERERTPAGTGARAVTTAKQDCTKRTDVDRLKHGRALVDSVSSILAANVLGDPAWDLADLELRLSLLRVLDTASRHLLWAVA